MEELKPKKLAVLIVIIAVLTAYTYVLRYREAVPPLPPKLELVPMLVGDFAGRNEHQEPESLRLLGADATIFRSFRNVEGQKIWLFIGYFGTQQERSQIHSPKNCYPGAGWSIVSERIEEIHADDEAFPAQQLTISDGREYREVVYWFATADGIITNEFALKWYQMKRALAGKPQTSAFIRFSTVTTPADEESWGRMIGFIEAIIPYILDALRGTAGTAASEADDHLYYVLHHEAAADRRVGVTHRAARPTRTTK